MTPPQHADDLDDEVRQRATRLFEYLRALRALREPRVRDVARHSDRRWWRDDVPDHPSCRVGPAEDGAWLRVAKAALPPAPRPPADSVRDAAAGPVLVVDGPEREPALAADLAARLPDDDDDERVGVEDRFRRWMEDTWRPWQGEARRAIAARRLYEALYDLRLRLQREEASAELV